MKLNMLTSVLVAALTQHPNIYIEITGSRVVQSARIAEQATAAPLRAASTAEQAPEQDKFEDIALKFASIYGHVETVKKLLNDYKVNIDHKDKDGWTALMYAEKYGHQEVVVLLKAAKAPNDTK